MCIFIMFSISIYFKIMYSYDGKVEFLAAITSVLRKMSYYYHIWKQLFS